SSSRASWRRSRARARSTSCARALCAELLVREDPLAARLRRDRGVIAARRVARRLRTTGRVRATRVELIVAVHDRRETSRGAGRDAEVVEEVATAGAGDPAPADGAEMDRRRCR